MESSPSGENSNPNSSTSSSRRHRRTGEDLHVQVDPAAVANESPSSIYPPKQAGSFDGNFNNGTGIPRPPMSADHARSFSWSLGANGYPTPMPYPYPFPSPYGSSSYQGYIDYSAMAASAAAAQQQQQQQEQHFHRVSGHKRSHSCGSPSSYGSLDSLPPTIPTNTNQRRSGDFSPRNELMKLAGSNSTPKGHHRRRSSSTSPQISPRTNSADLQQPSQRVSFSGNLPGGPTTIHGNSSNVGAGGEAVYLAQQKRRSGLKKEHSSRKMHMRQQSAQLFMEDYKGIEQIPACRDILFLMLFVFHLLGIVYLGNTYGFIEEPDNSTLLDDDEEPVTIMYNNVIYMACISGAFAVFVSACALFLMMAIAKKIVQVALILAITLSFVWGTIGIGFSPRIVVPASGFVALLLTVAYAFIVWDRIPFVASNLDAGLHGIRANLGLVFLAFVFQALALGWSVYFTFVVGGVYNALVTGNIDLTMKNSGNAKMAIYIGLGISYYWTMHVISVRRKASSPPPRKNSIYSTHKSIKFLFNSHSYFTRISYKLLLRV